MPTNPPTATTILAIASQAAWLDGIDAAAKIAATLAAMISIARTIGEWKAAKREREKHRKHR